MNELELMARLRDEVPLEPADHVQHSVMTVIRAGRKPRPVRRFRPALAAGVAVAVAAGAVAGVTIIRSNAQRQQRQVVAWSGRPMAPWAVSTPSYGKASSEAQLLTFAARAAAAVPDHAPRPDQWIALKTEYAQSSAGSGGFLFGPPDKRLVSLEWIKVDGSERAALLTPVPSTMSPSKTVSTRLDIAPDGMNHGSLCGWWSVSYSYLDSLPANPQALKQVILDQDRPVTKQAWSGAAVNNPCYNPNQPAAIFSAIYTLFDGEAQGILIPPKLAAALYQVLHLLPAVHFDSATDLAGRTGLGFYMVLEGYYKQEIVIDPTTYAYMGGESVAIKDHTMTGTDGTRYIKAGQVLGWDALLNLAIVNKPGQLPG